MTLELSPIVVSRLEKAATDNGFDLELFRDEQWLLFGSTQCPLRVWLGTSGDAVYLAAFSQQNVSLALGDYGTPILSPLPEGALGGRTVTDVPALHGLLRRAFQLSKTLPDELLHLFQKETEDLPRATEAERLVLQRIGQDLFRQGLIEFWEGKCAVTDLAVPELLRASHIKPWADCTSDSERLDVFNGLLLSPNLDAAFDRGLVTFADQGTLIPGPELSLAALNSLGVVSGSRILRLTKEHSRYLQWHRERIFRGASTPAS